MKLNKYTLLITALSLLCSFAAIAQTDTNSTPSTPGFGDIVSSNLDIVIYGARFENNGQFGGGGMFLYNFYETGFGLKACAGVGMDWAGSWYALGGNLAVKYQYNITPRFHALGYTFAGVGTSLIGANSDNGEFESVEGVGVHLVYDVTDKISLGAGGGYANRQGAGDYSGGAELITASASYNSDNILFPIGKIVEFIGGLLSKGK